MSLNIPGQREMIDGFKSRFEHPFAGKVNKERARRLKQNQAGSLRKKMRHACPRCHRGTLKMKGKGNDIREMKCNNPKCGYSKPWSRIGYNV